ncbi:MAG: flagellar hook assembly protein FlgD [candidate division Zixibacteria bacterium]|nr:flagellar hook assembly protein FlgD [candidate division Zixibacteria bacterium]
MTQVTPTTAGIFPGATSSQTATSVDQLGKDDFLKLMIAQMQNQDPLNPMEDADFIAQLAQFSSLEQMSNIATGIAESNQWDFLQMQSINNVMAAGIIGKEVQANYDGVYFDGSSSPKISFTSDQYADELQIVITGANGEVVATLSESGVSPGKHTYEWDGRDEAGNRVASGQYNVQVVGTSATGDTFRPSMKLTGLVEAVTYRDGTAYFRVDGVDIPFGDVATIGQEGSFGEGGQ